MRLAELTGSHADGTLQVAQSALNQVLQQLVASSATAPVVEIHPGNTVVVRYGALHARAELPAVMHPARSARLTLRLASQVVAWGLKALVRESYVHVSGRDLTIELDRVPALHPLREFWPHLRQVTFGTVPHGVRVGFSIVIAAPIPGIATGAPHA